MRRAAILTAATTTLATVALAGQSYRTITEARTARAEDSLFVDVKFMAGTLQLAPGDGTSLYRATINYNEGDFLAFTDYYPDKNRLEIGLRPKEDLVSRLGRIKTAQRLDLSVTPLVPLRLSLELGAAEAELELGGISLVGADIVAGAATAHLSFGEPNRTTCNRLTLRAGAAEFRADGLANARCHHIVFAGGVGDVTLDFTSRWTGAMVHSAEISLGLGQLTLRLPETLGVAIDVDRFLVSFDDVGFTKSGARYVSPGYRSATSKLDIKLKAVLGDIDIVWIEP